MLCIASVDPLEIPFCLNNRLILDLGWALVPSDQTLDSCKVLRQTWEHVLVAACKKAETDSQSWIWIVKCRMLVPAVGHRVKARMDINLALVS